MTQPIDPIRRSRRTRLSLPAPGETPDATPFESPGPSSGAGPREKVRSGSESNVASGAATLNAHLMGQESARRGLRGGAPVLDAARQAYETTEWSGGADRRKKAGRKARIKT